MDCAHEKQIQQLPAGHLPRDALHCAPELPLGVGHLDVHPQTAGSKPSQEIFHQSSSPEEHVVLRESALCGNSTRQADPEDLGRQLHEVPTEEEAVPEAEYWPTTSRNL